jgi:ATP-dependent Clp protease, protease subunit
MADLAGKKVAYFGYTGMIDSDGATRLAAALNMAVNKNYDEVYLCMSSIGGYVADGIYLYNHIRSLPITTVIHNTGTVSSIAVAIYTAADTRYCSQYGIFMIHPTTIGPYQEGLAAERLDAALKSALAEDARTEKILRQRTSLPEELLSARRTRDVNIGADDAVSYGLATSVCDFALPQGNEIIQI